MSEITTSPSGHSWSGTVDYGPGTLYAPTSVDQLQALVARTPRIRALGTRHSFSTVAASDADLVSLHAMPADIDIDSLAGTVRVASGIRYGELALAAWDAGLALPNMGSLPHISVAGASATGTHGSGNSNRALAAAVRAVTLVTADGELVELSRDEDPGVFDGVVLSLGALGVITHLVLDMAAAFEVRQAVYLDLPPERMTSDDLLALMGSAFSVSLFHDFDGHISQVWVKQRVQTVGGAASGPDALPTDATSPFPDTFFGAMRARAGMHPLPSLPGDFCTDQSGTPGPYFERLPHFRLEFTPSNGEEIQSEYYIAREDLAPALAALQPLAQRIRPALMVSEIRTVAPDEIWLSAAYQRASACLHFTWKRDPEAVQALLPDIEAALSPFSPRPHWGKVSTLAPDAVQTHYPRLPDFRALRADMDPTGKFANAYVDRMIGR